MRKADYMIVAARLRAAVIQYRATDTQNLSPGKFERANSDALQARQLAVYFSEALAVDRALFLRACGVDPANPRAPALFAT